MQFTDINAFNQMYRITSPKSLQLSRPGNRNCRSHREDDKLKKDKKKKVLRRTFETLGVESLDPISSR